MIAIFKTLKIYVESLSTDELTEERKVVLNNLVDYIQKKVDTKAPVNLNFICTHNSRRSHLGQIWAQCMSQVYGLEHVQCYSGGTEATALHPTIISSLQAVGYTVTALSEGTNTVYAIKYADNVAPIIGFSKAYDHDFNPKSDFAALMTCDHADANCPFIVGANARMALNYNDPKAFDGTPEQLQKYQERSAQIATEMKYVFQNIKTA